MHRAIDSQHELQTMSALTSLPTDVLIIIMETLDIYDLTVLSQTCRLLYSLVAEYGWSGYLRLNPRHSYSLSRARMHWNARISARYDLIADLRWSKCAYIARPLSPRWAGKFQPILAVSSSRLVVGAGSKIYFYSFGVPNNSSAPPVSYEGSASLLDRLDCPRNITALTFIEDGGLDRSLDIAFQDGSIERIHLSATPTITTALTITRHKLLPMAKNDFAESLCSQSEIILALSSTGQARLSTLSGSLTSTLDLNARSWTSHLCISASTPYAAFGTASKTPLTVHPILDGGHLRSHPIAILHTVTSSQTDLIPFEGLSSSAVYGLSQGPLNSPWGTSPQILVSGWYDGQVRIYDLRSSPSFSAHRRPLSSDNPSNCTASVAVHRPVLSLVDRWSYEPIYSVASGGGSAARVAAGTARHSVVSFWDIRQPTQGWSVHAPGNDSSPVYSIVMESSRFFGVTQSRPFVYDFGPGVSLDTYPPLPPIKGFDNLRRKKGSHRATYHVLSYPHDGSGVCNDF